MLSRTTPFLLKECAGSASDCITTKSYFYLQLKMCLTRSMLPIRKFVLKFFRNFLISFFFKEQRFSGRILFSLNKFKSLELLLFSEFNLVFVLQKGSEKRRNSDFLVLRIYSVLVKKELRKTIECISFTDCRQNFRSS